MIIATFMMSQSCPGLGPHKCHPRIWEGGELRTCVRHQVSLNSKAVLLQSLGHCCWSSLIATVACLSWLWRVGRGLAQARGDGGRRWVRETWAAVGGVRCTCTSPQPTAASELLSQDSYFCKWLSDWPTPKNKLFPTSLHINFLMTDYWVLYRIPLVCLFLN